MARGGSSWWNVALVVVLLAVMVVPAGALSSTSNTKAVKATPYQNGYDALETANGPSAVAPSASGPGNVTWTLCLLANHLFPGNDPSACGGSNGGPYGAGFDPANGDIYVANYDSSSVSVVSGASNKVVATVIVGSNPDGAAYDSVNGDIYVTNGGSYNVSVVSGASNKVVATIPVNSPVGAAFDSANGNIYVTNSWFNNVSVVSGASNTVVATIPVGSQPYGAAYDSVNGDIYVTNYDSGNVSVVSGTSNTVVATIPVGNKPAGAVYDSANGDLYITNQGSNNVSVVSGTSNTVVATIPVGNKPAGAVYDSANGDIYVTNINSNNVSVVSGTSSTVVATIPVGGDPWGAAYDSANGDIYVVDYLSGAVSIITTGPAPSTYPVSFSESGLPAGTSWSVGFGGQLWSSTGSTITASSEPNGTYPFTVGAVTGYTANITSGNVTVNGGPASQSVTFTPQVTLTSVTVSPSTDTLKVGTYANFTTTITCTGGTCPVGTTYVWSLNNTALGNLNATSGSSVKFTASSSGAEKLSVNATLNGHIAKNSSIITIATTPVPTLAYVSLTPLAATVNVSATQAFTAIVGCSGGTCPLGATYSWSLNNSLGKLNVSSGSQVLFTANSTAGLVNLTVTAHLNGKTATNSSAITIAKSSPPPSSFTVTFSESGLPSGTSWSVTLSGSTKSGTGNIVFTEPNGIYLFSVGAIAGYTASPSSSNVTVNGASKTVSITFTKSSTGTRYAVTFTETGLTTGTNWSVTLNGSTESSTTAMITFQEANGSYTFSVGTVSGLTVSPATGTLKVSGQAVSQSITFTKSSSKATYTVTFTESGLPSGTSWSVTLNGSAQSSTTATITFQEANGRYSFLVGTVSGYTVNPSSGTVKVNGGPASQSVAFTSSSSSKGKTNQTTGFLGLPGDDGYIVIGAVMAAVAIATAVLLMRGRGKRPAPVSSSKEEPERTDNKGNAPSDNVHFNRDNPNVPTD